MRRLIYSIFAVIVPLICYSQSVLSIPFGETYSNVKQKLQQRFPNALISEKNGRLAIYNIPIGNFEFRYGEFIFIWIDNNWIFNAAEFQAYYDLSDISVAKKDRDYLFEMIKTKYGNTVEESTNSEGFKRYGFGLNPYDDSRFLGGINLTKSEGNDGISRYYLYLSYFPILNQEIIDDF